MRYLRLLASGTLIAGAMAAGAQDMAYDNEWKLEVGGISSSSYREAYHLGYGMNGTAAYERAYGQTDSRLGLYGNFVDYQRDESVALPSSIQEYGVGLEALVGPALRKFEPKAGGHVGYVRQDAAGDDKDQLDLGFDGMLSYEFTPNVGVQGTITPLWLIDDDDTDYQTRGELNVQFIIPGA